MTRLSPDSAMEQMDWMTRHRVFPERVAPMVRVWVSSPIRYSFSLFPIFSIPTTIPPLGKSLYGSVPLSPSSALTALSTASPSDSCLSASCLPVPVGETTYSTISKSSSSFVLNEFTGTDSEKAETAVLSSGTLPAFSCPVSSVLFPVPFSFSRNGRLSYPVSRSIRITSLCGSII